MNDLDLLGKDLPQYKRIDGPWIGLLALGIFISLATLIAIPVLYFCWRRYQQTNQTEDTSEILDNKPTDQRQIPIQIDDQPRNFYGTQQIDRYIPPPDNIHRVHQFYERTSNAYF